MPPHAPIALGDLTREYAALRSAIDTAVSECLASGWFVLGQQGAAFENAFAEWLGHGARVAACGSGTAAIALALRALGLGPGSRVVAPVNTCSPTWMGIRMAGATIVPADCDADSLLLSGASVAHLLATERVDAVVVVHLYGNMPDMRALAAVCAERGVPLVEDCAQAVGAAWEGIPAGCWGDAAAFSFYPSKNLAAYGDGGAVITRDAAIDERVRRLRNYGYGVQRDWPLEEGFNARLDELQAAILRAKLPHLDAWQKRRAWIAEMYEKALEGHARLRPVRATGSCTTGHHLFVVRTPDRDGFRAHLQTLGVLTGIHYPVPLHRTPAFAPMKMAEGRFPHAEQACREIVSIPMHPFLTDDEAARVTSALRAW